MLEGKIVNLRIMEKEDSVVLVNWLNNPDFLGEFWDYFPLQRSQLEIEKLIESGVFEPEYFMVEKKDGSTIGFVNHFNVLHPPWKTVGNRLCDSSEREGQRLLHRGVGLILDYLFL